MVSFYLGEAAAYAAWKGEFQKRGKLNVFYFPPLCAIQGSRKVLRNARDFLGRGDARQWAYIFAFLAKMESLTYFAATRFVSGQAENEQIK